MTHHAGKGFAFVSGACTISQCVGPNCFLCENMGWKSRWLAEDLSLAGALRLKLPWLMEMVYAVLPPGLHMGARGKGTLSALPTASWQEEEEQQDPKPTLASLPPCRSPPPPSPPVVSVNNVLYFSCLFLSITIFFFKRSDAVATSITNRQTSIIICFMTLNLASHCKYSLAHSKDEADTRTHIFTEVLHRRKKSSLV